MSKHKPSNRLAYKHYKLIKDIPLCPTGTIFYHDINDDESGSISAGCLKLAWIGGNCQNNLCGDTIVFPANAVKDRSWFIPLGIRYVKAIAEVQSKLRSADIYLEVCEIEKQLNLFLVDKNESVRKAAEKLYKVIHK